jgi:sensor histidine kinase YesM
MQRLPFIFSNEPKFRIARHIAFWLILFLGQASVSLIVPSFLNRYNNERLYEATYGQLLYLPSQLFIVYTLLYFVIPRFILKGKYKLTFFWIIIICLVTGFIASLCYWFLADYFASFLFGRRNFLEPKPFSGYISVGFINGLKASLIVAGCATSIKLLKHWYEKEHRNSVLQKEKLNAELQSLKAQLHPHFLFNTLNNIYSITQNSSPLASEMLVKLSDLLRYILYECDQPQVRLSKEIKLLKDYIELEKIRYTQNLDLDISLPENTNSYVIAPLLLLPLVENCFKHGSSKLLEQPWIKIEAELKENILYIKMINAKPVSESTEEIHYGIGLNNVQKRLNLLYPDKYEFKIISEQEIFIVNLKLELEK